MGVRAWARERTERREEQSDPEPTMWLAVAIADLALAVFGVSALMFGHRGSAQDWYWIFPAVWLFSSVVSFRRAGRARVRRAKENALFQERQRRFPVGLSQPTFQPPRSAA